jgi:hypothetical protein
MKYLEEPIYWAPQKKLGGGWICFKDSPAPPPAPDYAGAATATATGNLDAARAAADANRVNQVTPYGNLTYTRDPNAATPDQGWTATQTLSPAQQQLLDQQNRTSISLGNLAGQGLGYVQNAMNNSPTMASLPASMVNAGQTGQDALMARFQPMMDQSNKALDAQLANQGIMPGSEAYNNAMRTQQQGNNDLRSQAALNGIQVGQQAQQQALQVQTALQNQPVNMLNAVRTGSQVTNPSFTSVPQQATTSGPDLMGATQGTANYNQGIYNSGVASANSGNSAAAGAAGTALMVGAMMF